jgi:protease YdgD
MRVLAAAAAIAACVLASVAMGGARGGVRLPPPSVSGASAFEIERAPAIGKQTVRRKPERRGDDSCRWANDNECDDPDIGTGACRMGTDYSDCWRLREGREDDSCRWARDGECDEPNFGTGACVQGSDRTDCGDIAWMRNQNDSCATAFNNVCDEPGRGDGACRARTDRADCHGRNRPMAINDHFFGRDDRVLVSVDDLPWRFMGVLRMDTGEACTATLIGRDVLVTAAHCIHTDRGVNASGRWESASGGLTARVTGYLIDPRFDYARFNSGSDIDGLDWALLRLDQPLGDRLGHAGVQNLTGQGRQRALSTDLMQAGYSWDTGGRLSGNLRCRMASTSADNTFSHECDTTRGDSGSAFVVRNGDGYDVVGIDSKFRSNPNGPFIYVAVSAAAFVDRVPDFLAGRTGLPVGGARTTKPRRTDATGR